MYCRMEYQNIMNQLMWIMLLLLLSLCQMDRIPAQIVMTMMMLIAMLYHQLSIKPVISFFCTSAS